MVKKLLKKIVILCAPFIFIAICYLLTDPYKKIWSYDRYLFDYMMLSRGDVSTRVYLKNKDKYHYNSFIFGSSRSCAHTSREWSRYLSAGDIPYSYGSFNEPLLGIYRKIALIDSLNEHIKNAIIIIDLDRTFLKSCIHFLSYDHYLISGISKYEYYTTDFITYLNSPALLFKSIDYTLFHKQRKYMVGFVGMKEKDWDPVTNDWYPDADETIDTVAYYTNHKSVFYARPLQQRYEKKQIDAFQLGILTKMSSVFKKHHTKCKLIVAPLYNQMKMDSTDLKVLQTVFGKENIYDYSGINEITNNMYNYCNDSAHYKPKVGKLIFKEIYQTK
jgi:hypothetical protein